MERRGGLLTLSPSLSRPCRHIGATKKGEEKTLDYDYPRKTFFARVSKYACTLKSKGEEEGEKKSVLHAKNFERRHSYIRALKAEGSASGGILSTNCIQSAEFGARRGGREERQNV